MRTTLLAASAAFCVAFSHPAWPQAKQPDPNLPMKLYKEDEDAGLAKVRPYVKGCASSYSVKGKVTVAMKVAPDGAVSSVSVKETPDRQLSECIASELRKAKFRRTNNGGSFSTSFSF
jgi:hypothetical protein